MPGTDATHNPTPGTPAPSDQTSGGGALEMPSAEDIAVQAIAELIAAGYTSSVMKLSRPTLNELARRLVQPGEKINDAAVEWLELQGHALKRSSVYRFAQRYREKFKTVWAGWADKLVWMRKASDPNLKTDDLVDLIRNQTRVLIAREVMTSDVAELDTKRIGMYLKLVENAESAQLERAKLDLARRQAQDRAVKLEAEVERLTLENDRRRRELQRAIEAAKKDVQTAVEGRADKSMTEDQVIAILDRVMKGESPGSEAA